MFLIFLMNLLFALTFIIGKTVLNYSPPIFFIAIRMVLAGFSMLFYQFLKKDLRRIDKTDIKLFFILSIIHIYIPYVLEFWALQYVTAAKAAFLFNLAPFITALFGIYLFKEKISNKKIIGLIIGFIGFLPILISQTPVERNLGEIFFISLPELFLLISVVSASYAWIIIQKNLKEKNYSLITLNGASMLLGGLLALISSVFIEKIVVSDMINFAILTLSMIIIGNILCYNLYASLLKKYSATFISFSGFTIPLFTAFFQWIFFKELITWHFIIATFFVAFGLYLYYLQE